MRDAQSKTVWPPTCDRNPFMRRSASPGPIDSAACSASANSSGANGLTCSASDSSRAARRTSTAAARRGCRCGQPRTPSPPGSFRRGATTPRNVGRPVQRGDVLRSVVLAAVHDRNPAGRPWRVLIFRPARPLRGSGHDTDRSDRGSASRPAPARPAPATRIPLQESIEGQQTIGNALRVVEPIDAHDDAPIADVETLSASPPLPSSTPSRETCRSTSTDRC